MAILDRAWRKIITTKAVENASGDFELMFFETIYRISYLIGISSAEDGLPYFIYKSACGLLVILLVVGEFWYLFSKVLSLDEFAASMNILVMQFCTLYRYWNMTIHRKIYRKLATSMESPYFDTSTEKRKNLVRYWSQRNERYLKLLLYIGNSTLVAWFLYPLLDDIEYNMSIQIRLPWSHQGPYSYALSYLLVVMLLGYVAYLVMLNDIIMQAYLLHLVCQLAVLGDGFENILNDCQIDLNHNTALSLLKDRRFEYTYKRRLDSLVKQHRFILRHIVVLRHTLSGPMLGQLAASGTLICFIGYQAATTGAQNVTKCVMSLFYLGYNLFEFYIICRWCEEITVQSQRIGEAAYCSNWESGASMVAGAKSTLLLVVARANKPLMFTAGGMYDLSLLSYSNLVKTSYSALTVLLRFRQN